MNTTTNAIVSHTNHCRRLTFIAIVPPRAVGAARLPPRRGLYPYGRSGVNLHICSQVPQGVPVPTEVAQHWPNGATQQNCVHAGASRENPWSAASTGQFGGLRSL